tara:strand:+ start:122 stop:784 length:663 start_codon:yes stop_codon:yes gene_type:complete
MSIIETRNVFHPTCHDSAVIRCLLSGRVWEKKIVTIFEQYLNPEDIAIDCGAYIGSHSIVLSNLCQKVYAFEPTPLIFGCLSKTIEHKQINNIVLHNIALSNKIGEDYIFTSGNGDSSLSGIRHNEEIRFKEKHLVNLNLLDNVIPATSIDAIKLIKIDCEGSEWNVVAGADQIIEKSRPIIIIESWKNKKNANKLNEFCVKYNYISTHITGDNFLLKPK